MEQNILIDKLEDQLIDNPDASTTEQLKEHSYDETFQKKLNERADLFSASADDKNANRGSYFQFLVTKLYLDYDHKDFGPLDDEISLWFVSADFALLDLDRLATQPSYDVSKLTELPAVDISAEHSQLDALVYFAMGQYGQCSSKEAQINKITENCRALLARNAVAFVVPLLFSAMKCPKSRASQRNYLILLTVVYFMLCVALEGPRDECLVDTLRELDLMGSVFEFVDLWRLDPQSSGRLRNVVLLLWKLILVEFGTSADLAKADDFLNEKHEIVNKDRKAENRLVCSPLDLYTFREDLLDKYPIAFDSPPPSEQPSAKPSKQSDEFMALHNYLNSLSNLLMTPRTNKDHTILGKFPVQTLHIATPVPLPPQTPSDFLSGGEKIRKLYHVNQGMPFVYPQDGTQELPEAIREAHDIFELAVYESYSVKRLWAERQRYMAQERGFQSQYSLPDETFEDKSPVAKSLNRVEQVYAKTLPQLPSLIKVLVSVVRLSKIAISLKDYEIEVNPETSFAAKYGDPALQTYKDFRGGMLRQLEAVRTRETTLQASAAIIILLLRWFKASHVLKFYYLNLLVFDEQFFPALVDFLGNALSNPDLQDFEHNTKVLSPYDVVASQNRLMNPRIYIPEFDFFVKCTDGEKDRILLINRNPISNLPCCAGPNSENVVHITSFNRTFVHILVNLFQIANKLLIKNISQRTFVLDETKPTDMLKMVLQNYINDSLRTPVLKIFKKLVPYQGRKWRAMNMDVVLQIFLHLKLSLRDNWLSGRDLENDFNNSFDQEIALRSLLQFYNVRRYPEQMEKLGFAVSCENVASFDFDEW